MVNTLTIAIPDIGDFKDVPVIEVLVKPGDTVEKETSLITLETDKAAMEVPSPHAGTVKMLLVKVGDKVSQGSAILTLEQSAVAESSVAPVIASDQSVQAINTATQPSAELHGDMHAEVVVLGAGPGGYTAAFRSADLGKKVILIERYANLGGSASMSVVFHPKRCCMWPKLFQKQKQFRNTVLISVIRRLILTNCVLGKNRSSIN